VRLPANERESDVACFRTPPRRVLPRVVLVQGVTKYDYNIGVLKSYIIFYCQNYINPTTILFLPILYLFRTSSRGGCTLREYSSDVPAHLEASLIWRVPLHIWDPLFLTTNCLHYGNIIILYILSPLALNFDSSVVAKDSKDSINSRTEIVTGLEINSENGWELQRPSKRLNHGPRPWLLVSHGLNYLLQTICVCGFITNQRDGARELSTQRFFRFTTVLLTAPSDLYFWSCIKGCIYSIFHQCLRIWKNWKLRWPLHFKLLPCYAGKGLGRLGWTGISVGYCEGNW